MLFAQQAAASEFDKTQGAKGLSKAEAAELEASWQQQVGFYFDETFRFHHRSRASVMCTQVALVNANTDE